MQLRRIHITALSILLCGLISACNNKPADKPTSDEQIESANQNDSAQRKPADKPAAQSDQAKVEATPRIQSTGVPHIDLSKLSTSMQAFIVKLQQAAAAAPGSANRITELGKYYYGNGFLDAAIECFQRAVEILPKSLAHRYRLALALEAAGKQADAMRVLEDATAISDAYPAVFVHLANLYVNEGNWSRAKELYTQSLATDDNDPLAHYGLGRCAAAEDQNEEALKHFERAIELQLDYADAHIAAADALEQLGREAEAAQHRKLAENGRPAMITNDPIRYDLVALPRSESAIARSTMMQAEAGQIEDAIRNLELARNAGLSGMPIEWTLGKLRMQQGRFGEAMTHLKAALEMAPGNPSITYSLCMTCIELGLFDDAERIIEQLRTEHPTEAATDRLEAILLAKQGKIREAIASLDVAFSTNPNDGQSHALAGSIHLQEGKTQEAKQHLKRAIELQPQDVRSRFLLGSILANENDDAGAEAQWREAVKTAPSYQDARVSLAALLIKQKRSADAVGLLQQGLKLTPDSVMMANAIAWVLAVSNDDEVRNGPEALKWALIACEKTQFETPQFLDTLAAAHAACGQFNDAVRFAESAIKRAETAGMAKEAKTFAERLKLYQSNRPYRE